MRIAESERGYVVVTSAVVMTALLAFAGLAIDVGYLEYTKRRMQAAADSGAQAGALELRQDPNASVTSPVRQDAETNGFTHGQDGVTVAVNSPPLSGAFAAMPNFVEVEVRRQVPTFFMKVLNRNAVEVVARAVGGPATPPNCIYALNPTASGALKVSGSSTIGAACGVLVNSSSATAMEIGNAACFDATAYGVVGGYSGTGSCGLDPTPRTSMAPFRDPLATLPAPTYGACDFTKFKTNSSITINPGVYCDGITVNGGTLTLNPGIYVLLGGGLKVTGGASLTGSGVMFYNTAGPGNAFDTISINGGGVLNLSAPTSGIYESVLFYQDRNAGAGEINVINGDSSSQLVGTLYFPTSTVKFTGNANATMYTTIIGDMVEFTGNSTVNNNYAGLSTSAIIRTPSVVE